MTIDGHGLAPESQSPHNMESGQNIIPAQRPIVLKWCVDVCVLLWGAFLPLHSDFALQEAMLEDRKQDAGNW